MIEQCILVKMFDSTLSALGLIREGRKHRDQKIDQALFALYAALVETKVYVSDLNAGKRRNKKKEWALARLWHDASVPIRYIDQDLAHQCFIKGSYWAEPDLWTEAKIEKNGITLDKVYEETRKLLLRK
jgi:hypothetical protein